MEDVSRMLTPHLRHVQQQNKAGPSHTISKNKWIKRIAFQRCKTWVLFPNSKIRCVRLVTLGHVANRASAAFLRLKCQSYFLGGETGKQILLWVPPSTQLAHPLWKRETMVPPWLLWILRRKAFNKQWVNPFTSAEHERGERGSSPNVPGRVWLSSRCPCPAHLLLCPIFYTMKVFWRSTAWFQYCLLTGTASLK